MNLARDHWHIELSSRCPLKCPRCPRAEVPESLLNKQLTLDFFKEYVGADVVKNIKKITLCGNDGDPIYCTDLINIIKWFKQCNPEIMIVIITNGSNKPKCWWRELAYALDEHDEVNWSIDGFNDASNNMYRINSNWKTIIDGVEAFIDANDTTYTVWAAIAFKFNQDNLDQMKELATEMDFDLFQLTKSTKFGSKYSSYPANDPLEPRKDLVSSSERYERELSFLTNKVRCGQSIKETFRLRKDQLIFSNNAGICTIGNKGLFLNSRGELYPCCWVANRFEHNESWTSNALNLYNEPVSKLDDWYSDRLFTSQECTAKCTREKLADDDHTLEW